MKNKFETLSILALPFIGFIACQETTSFEVSQKKIATEPVRTHITQSALASKPIELPLNYNQKNFRKLLMGVDFNKVKVKTGHISSKFVETLSTRLQTEMAKLKRFSVFAIHNNGGMSTLELLSENGKITLKQPKRKTELDLLLNANISITK